MAGKLWIECAKLKKIRRSQRTIPVFVKFFCLLFFLNIEICSTRSYNMLCFRKDLGGFALGWDEVARRQDEQSPSKSQRVGKLSNKIGEPGNMTSQEKITNGVEFVTIQVEIWRIPMMDSTTRIRRICTILYLFVFFRCRSAQLPHSFLLFYTRVERMKPPDGMGGEFLRSATAYCIL